MSEQPKKDLTNADPTFRVFCSLQAMQALAAMCDTYLRQHDPVDFDASFDAKSLEHLNTHIQSLMYSFGKRIFTTQNDSNGEQKPVHTSTVN